MTNIFIIHGSYASPKKNWFPWLKKQLEKSGHQVFVPQFPIPKVQDPYYSGHSLGKWITHFQQFRHLVNRDTIFVAHSRGCVFLYNLLPTLERKVRAVYLVAPWLNYRWYPKDKKMVDSFHERPFEWERIRKASQYFEIYQSTNDDTPVEEGEEIARKLDAKLIVVKGAGHFNVATDIKYKKFPLLFRNIIHK